MTPTVFVMCNLLAKHSFENGVSAITHEDIRWHRCDIKAITLLPNILLRQLANDTGGAYEAILIRDGKVTEGAASNVFIVRGNTIITPPKGHHILPGITRDLLVELLREAGLPLKQEFFSEQVLREADEIWLTGSTTGVAPVVKLDGNAVGDGKPGKGWHEASSLFNAYIDKIRQTG